MRLRERLSRWFQRKLFGGDVVDEIIMAWTGLPKKTIATLLLLTLIPGCLLLGCTTASSLAGFSNPKVTITRTAAGAWKFEADSDFNGTGKITARTPDGAEITVDIHALSDASPVTVAQGQRYADSGLADVQREAILAQKEAFNGVLNLIGSLAPMLRQPEPAPPITEPIE